MRLSPVLLVFLLFVLGCQKEPGAKTPDTPVQLTIFFVNDQHGRLENFAKVKYIVDRAKENGNVLLACSGDIFSGNPVVDQYPDKGYPIIDIMNRTGFDISVIGNHEFDYGTDALKNRVDQATFKWVCANVDMQNTGIQEPDEYYTIQIGDLRICFLGLVETNGKPGATIPSTHPWKVQDIHFDRPESVVAQYQNLKADENADLLIALTHLGHDSFNPAVLGDFDLANQFPFFDLIIGGHTNQLLDTLVNGIPVYQAGNNLNFLGRIDLTIQDKSVQSAQFDLIDLNTYSNFDQDIATRVQAFNDEFPELDDVLGHSQIHHTRWYNVGCFVADALRVGMQVDVSFQNSGGIRDDLDEGDILRREIYSISPFNNGAIVYEMTVAEIKDFLRYTGQKYFFSGLQIEQQGTEVVLKDLNGNVLSDSQTLTVGTIDYIPAVHDSFFPSNGQVQPLNDAETVIHYLENYSQLVNYPNCDNHFRYQ